jgi:hypothetical protein
MFRALSARSEFRRTRGVRRAPPLQSPSWGAAASAVALIALLLVAQVPGGCASRDTPHVTSKQQRQWWRPASAHTASSASAVHPLSGSSGSSSSAVPPSRRRLHDFRMNVGPATFTDPAASADDPLGLGLPAPGAEPPAPAAASANRAPERRAALPAGAGGAKAGTLQLPRCYFSKQMNRCFMNPYYPLAYAPPGEDPAARCVKGLAFRGALVPGRLGIRAGPTRATAPRGSRIDKSSSKPTNRPPQSRAQV